MIGLLTQFDFITNLRLRKKVVFPNLIWIDKKKILILELGSLVMCREGVRHSATPVRR